MQVQHETRQVSRDLNEDEYCHEIFCVAQTCVSSVLYLSDTGRPSDIYLQ